MLETVVALAVLLAAVLGPVALITRSVSGMADARLEIMALNLAQEGIELVRAVRENNILCEATGQSGANWRQDYDGSANLLLGTDRSIDATNVFSRACSGTGGTITVSNPNLSSGCTARLLVDSLLRFGYLNGNASSFTRCVTISEPATSETVNGFTVTPPNMMDVVSRVEWQRRGTIKNVELRERLYNWR